MAYWWVNQGRTFAHAFKEGFLWAPNPSIGNLPHWHNMTLLQAGDIVFCYSDKKIRALCTIQAPPAPLLSPYPDDWAHKEPGTVAIATFVALPTPVSYKQIVGNPHNLSLVGAKPKLQLSDKPALGYLFSLPENIGVSLLAICNVQPPSSNSAPKNPPTGGATERIHLALARIGQGMYGKDVRGIFGHVCALTGLSGSGLMLQAAHIKPWAKSTSAEKLDPENGILLHATLHHAFDQGHISFNDQGNLLTKTDFSKEAAILGLNPAMKLPPHSLTPGRRAYLLHHRTTFGFLP